MIGIDADVLYSESRNQRLVLAQSPFPEVDGDAGDEWACSDKR